MSITEAIELLKSYNGPLGLTLHKPASEELISKVEKAYGIVLPQDFKTLYRFTNGFETEEDIFNMIPLEEIIDNKKWHKDAFYIAEYMIFCDMWCLKVNPQNNEDYEITVIAYEPGRISLTNSLGEFISRFLKGGVFEIGGLYAWTDEIIAKIYGNTVPDDMKPLLWVFRECLKRGLMTKEYVIHRADWIIATEENPDHFFIEMSLSRNLNHLITILDSLNFTDDLVQVRAFFGHLGTKLSVDQITTEQAISILNQFCRDELLTKYERDKIISLIVDFDYLQDWVVKPNKKLKQKLRDDVKDFFHHYWQFNLFHIKGWEKTNADLVAKFEGMKSQ